MANTEIALTGTDINHLKYCLTLAKESLEAGDKPFGSILVNSDNEVIAESRNRVNELTPLAHPEIDLAHWSAQNLTQEERRQTTMYTTGEHCPMCAAAHGWVGLGTIVYLSSAKQLMEWLEEMNIPQGPIQFCPVQEIITNIDVRGPASGLFLDEIKALHVEYYRRNLPKK